MMSNNWLKGPLRSHVWDAVAIRIMDQMNPLLWRGLWDIYGWHIPYTMIRDEIYTQMDINPEWWRESDAE
jgi:hypothetical protein